jgi:hypothetical protein
LWCAIIDHRAALIGRYGRAGLRVKLTRCELSQKYTNDKVAIAIFFNVETAKSITIRSIIALCCGVFDIDIHYSVNSDREFKRILDT